MWAQTHASTFVLAVEYRLCWLLAVLVYLSIVDPCSVLNLLYPMCINNHFEFVNVTHQLLTMNH